MRRASPRHIPFLFLLSYCATLCSSFALNRTIDDERGDIVTGRRPVYLERWSQGASCFSCNIHPGLVNVTRPLDATWHDATFHPNGSAPPQVQLSFNGTAIYVYNLLANHIPATDTTTSLRFLLDGEFVGQFDHTPAQDGSELILYNQLVYSNSSLANAEHTLIMEPSPHNISVILFDYAIYTVESDLGAPSSPTSPSPALSSSTSNPVSSPNPPAEAFTSSAQSNSPIIVGAVVGIIVGIITALLTLTISILVLRKRRAWSTRSSIFRRRSVQSDRRATLDPTSNLPDENASSSGLLHDLSPRQTPLPSPEPSSRTASFLSSFTAHPRTPSPVVSALNLDDEIERGLARGRSVSFANAALPTRWASALTPGRATPLATPPGHRVDVPGPAFSVTGTEHSTRLTGLVQEIRTLEREIRELERGAPGVESSVDSLPSDGKVSYRALKQRVARLRGQVERERRLLVESLPKGKKVVIG